MAKEAIYKSKKKLLIQMQMCYKIGGHELLQKWMSNSEIYLSIYFQQKRFAKKSLTCSMDNFNKLQGVKLSKIWSELKCAWLAIWRSWKSLVLSFIINWGFDAKHLIWPFTSTIFFLLGLISIFLVLEHFIVEV